MSKLEVGQKVFLKAVGNNARYDKEVRIEIYEIKKVGRKYFEVGKDDDPRFKNDPRFFIRFHIEDYREVTNYSADWNFYFSEQEIIDEIEAEQLTRDIKRVFDVYGKVDLSLEQLRKISEIINTK